MAYDAVNRRTYEAGKVYRSSGGYETRLFQHVVDKGLAEVYTPEKKKETKVTTPAETKVKRKRTQKTPSKK